MFAISGIGIWYPSRLRTTGGFAGERVRSLLVRTSSYLSEAVLPAYVIRQTVVVLLASYVVNWRVNAPLKYAALCVLSPGIIIGIYDTAIRHPPMPGVGV